MILLVNIHIPFIYFKLFYSSLLKKMKTPNFEHNFLNNKNRKISIQVYSSTYFLFSLKIKTKYRINKHGLIPKFIFVNHNPKNHQQRGGELAISLLITLLFFF